MKIEACILDVDYVLVSGEPVVRIWAKTEKGENIVVLDRAFRPYLYILTKIDPYDLRAKILNQNIPIKIASVEVVKRKIYGKEKDLLKITIPNPLELRDLRDFFKNWESIKSILEFDIPFYKRYFIDNNIRPLDWFEIEGEEIDSGLKVDKVLEFKNKQKTEKEGYPKFSILAFDTEVLDKEIISIAITDSKFIGIITSSPSKQPLQNVIYVESEEEILKKFCSIIEQRDPDIICGYNTDLSGMWTLLKTAEKYKLDLIIGRDFTPFQFSGEKAYVRGRMHLDLSNFFENILSRSLDIGNMSLDTISKSVLGIDRSPLDLGKARAYWESGEINQIILHNKKGASICFKLMNKLLYQILELSRISGQTIFDSTRMPYSKLVEWLFIRSAYQKGEVCPNKPTRLEVGQRKENIPYIGGYVHTPNIGIHNNLALFDFKSLYPSIIMLHNVSPETLNCQCCSNQDIVSMENKVPEEEYYFCKTHKGFVPEVLKELYNKRSQINEKIEILNRYSEELKDLKAQEYAIKILSNAIYGYYAYPKSRWYSTICAKSVASWGRFYIKKTIEELEKKYEIVYGDTDSIFLKIESEVKARELSEEVNKNLPSGLYLDLKGFYKSGLFVSSKTGEPSKKRYALLTEDEKIVIRGFEKVRLNWCKLAKDLQEKIITLVLVGEIKQSADCVKVIIDDLQNERVKIKDLVIRAHISKPIEKYEHRDPHVSAAEKAVNRGAEIKIGDLIGYVITKGPGSISEKAEILEFAESYDTEYYINKQIIPVSLRVLSDFGYTEESFLPNKQQSLEKFMKKSIKEKIRKSILGK